MSDTETLVTILIFSVIFGIFLVIWLFHVIRPWLEAHGDKIIGIIFLGILGTALGYVLYQIIQNGFEWGWLIHIGILGTLIIAVLYSIFRSFRSKNPQTPSISPHSSLKVVTITRPSQLSQNTISPLSSKAMPLSSVPTMRQPSSPIPRSSSLIQRSNHTSNSRVNLILLLIFIGLIILFAVLYGWVTDSMAQIGTFFLWTLPFICVFVGICWYTKKDG